jgi:hypothetical protein
MAIVGFEENTDKSDGETVLPCDVVDQTAGHGVREDQYSAGLARDQDSFMTTWRVLLHGAARAEPETLYDAECDHLVEIGEQRARRLGQWRWSRSRLGQSRTRAAGSARSAGSRPQPDAAAPPWRRRFRMRSTNRESNRTIIRYRRAGATKADPPSRRRSTDRRSSWLCRAAPW